MELGNLSGLLWGLLAIPVVILYILKIRLRRAPVSTVMFWDQIFDEKRPRSIWHRLRHLLSLLLQLAFLSLLVGALADPSFTWEKLQARRLVLVVDNSASMNATDRSPTRLDRARQEGRRLIRGLRTRDQMAIISAGSTPHVEIGLTSHQRTLFDTLDALKATDGPTGVAAAVQLARQLLAGHKNARVIVLTDGCFPDADKLALADDVDFTILGDQTPNVAMTQFQVRRSLRDPIGYQILLEVSNLSDQPVERRLEISLDDELVDVIPLSLEAEERWSKVIDQITAAGGRLVARLDREDALAADNRAVALLPERKRLPVLLVTEGSLFLRRVFEAIPIVELAMTDTIPDALPSGAIVAFHRLLPDKLPPGNVLVIDPRQGCDLWTVGESLQNPILTDQDADSPLMTHVRLDNVLMPEAKKLDFTVEPQVLASCIGGDPVYCAIERPEGRVLVLTVNLAKGDLPLRTAFPIMMTNVLVWFQGGQGELREALCTGSLVDIDLEASATSDAPAGPLQLCSPEGTTRPLPAGVTEMTVGPLDHCGVWKIKNRSASEPDTLLELACNLANPGESDLRPSLQHPRQARADTFGFGGRPIWFYLTAAALILAAAEWFLYQRRWIS
ncbi:MAG: vWA domain-containing protein [Planctomycetota bacterium]|jgi:hypothetical protein